MIGWVGFLIGFLVCAVILYLPGFFLIRNYISNTSISLSVAPVFSVGLYGLIAFVFFLINAPLSGCIVFCMSCLIPLAILVFRSIKLGTSIFQKKTLGRVMKDIKKSKVLLLYLGVAICIAVYYFVLPLDGASSVAVNYDNITHYNMIRDCLNTGFYWPETFYPPAWSIVVAILISLTGLDIGIAVNATVMTFIVCVFPLGLFAFLHTCFGWNKKILISGSLVCLLCIFFPWHSLAIGQQLANFVALSLIFCAVAVTLLVYKNNVGRKTIGLLLVLLVLFSLVIAQTSAVFMWGILVVSFLIQNIVDKILALKKNNQQNKKYHISLIVLVVVSCFVWVVLNRSSLMASVVTYEWPPFYTIPEAIIKGLLFEFTQESFVSAQPILSLFLVIGFYKIVRLKNNWWLLISYGIIFVMFVVSSTCDGLLQQLFSGFWYNDQTRIGQMLCLVSLPIISVGVASSFELLKDISQRSNRIKNLSLVKKRSLTCLGAFALLFAVATPVSPFSDDEGDHRTGFGRMHDRIESCYDVDKVGLSEKEREFAKEAEMIVGDEGIIINSPYDGSVYLYSLDNANVLFDFYQYGQKHPEESKVIRENLVDIIESDEVKKAVETVGAKYVLLLDQDRPDAKGRVRASDYDRADWNGIESINDETPGFKVVLSKDDMRLYKIEY